MFNVGILDFILFFFWNLLLFNLIYLNFFGNMIYGMFSNLMINVFYNFFMIDLSLNCFEGIVLLFF